jgi:hypothetical protein
MAATTLVSTLPNEVREMTIEQHFAPPSEPTELRAQAPAPVSAGETVFSVLGDQARSRSRSGLWTTVIGGVLNAGIVWWQYPTSTWLAAGCLSAAAYGAWGLFDRAILAKAGRADTSGGAPDALAEMRGLMAVLGTGAAVWTVVGFLLAALGNWH